MVPSCATNRGTRHPMVTCHMANDGADGGALDATMRTSDDRKHLSTRYPERLGKFQEILAVPFKRGARLAPIEYLESKDVEALLARIDRRVGARYVWTQSDFYRRFPG
jgi:hypothetical protein